jgi:CheY-like chemotaxis protein
LVRERHYSCDRREESAVTEMREPVRVLVVDDNHDAADSLAILLRLWGYEVWVAYDGVAGLGAARHFRPQVALLDIQMPRMHGGEVARRLRCAALSYLSSPLQRPMPTTNA